MSYRPGNEFAVASTTVIGDDGKSVERRQAIYQHRWIERTANSGCVELDDGERVRVIDYVDGAVLVERLRNGDSGWLG